MKNLSYQNNSFLTQTPQAYRFKELYNLAINEKNKISDEATLFINKNICKQLIILTLFIKFY